MILLGTLYAEEVFANQYAGVKEDKTAEAKKAVGLLEAARTAWKDPEEEPLSRCFCSLEPRPPVRGRAYPTRRCNVCSKLNSWSSTRSPSQSGRKTPRTKQRPRQPCENYCLRSC